MCCFYDVLIVVISLFVDKIFGEKYLCYYIIVDGYYCGCKVIVK